MFLSVSEGAPTRRRPRRCLRPFRGSEQMNVALLNDGSPTYIGNRSVRKSFFEHGGGFEQFHRGGDFYARRLGRDLSGGTAPGTILKTVGGAVANLHRAFVTSTTSPNPGAAQEDTSFPDNTSSIDVLA